MVRPSFLYGVLACQKLACSENTGYGDKDISS